jgi:Zn-dependent peptidase ImmA (M78 family)
MLAQFAVRGAPVPVEHLALRLGLAVERADLGRDVSGVLVVRNGRGLIGVNADQAPTRQRFSIAHELGHFVLHRIQMPVFIDTQFTRPYLAAFRDATSSTGEDKREREANAFAAALLMPESLVRDAVARLALDVEDDAAIVQLAKRFDVSRQAMTYRLVNLLAGSRG